MKTLFKKVLSILIALACTFLFACAYAADKEGGGYYGDMVETVPGATEDGETGGGEETQENQIQKPAGLLTAGAWNDNDNYEDWLKLFSQEDVENVGKFAHYLSDADLSWGFNTMNRVVVEVKNAETAVTGATVVSKDEEGNILYKTVTNSNGKAYLFPNVQNGIVEVCSGEGIATAIFDEQTKHLTVNLEKSLEKTNLIELMFVIDVTGSMGDELEYLKNEIADVINKVALADANTQINLALLFYRDHTDSEVFKYYDFENVSKEEGMVKQQNAINLQRASGGGDYEEAVDEALAIAVEKQWTASTSTKIIFHVLDAPPHNEKKNKTTFKGAVDVATELGIRICPLLCSGAASLTEYLMREAAISTGGTFVYLTDDSGIGNEHHDPNLPNVTIEALNSLMVRLIKGYHSGIFEDPIDWRQEIK